VGLIAFLAHLGCFVPASAATVGLLDGIYTRISTRESSSVTNSAFLLDLTQVATMLHHATPRSLLLLDEFGKGTDPEDGAALLGACVEHIAGLRSLCIATTHFSELFNAGVLRADLSEAPFSF
jgi:DNA mismatch repair protein MSH5